jgi:hypothetical protein
MDQSKFKLESFKLIQGGGAEIHYQDEFVDGDETFYDKHKLTTAKVHHPNLMNILNQMKSMFAKAFDYSFMRDIILKPEFKANKSQTEIAENTYQEILKKIDISGVQTSGKGDKRGCVINAKFTSPTGKKRKKEVPTEFINFSTQKYGFEDELDRLVSDLEDEVYEFIFNNKRAKAVQGDLFQGQEGGKNKDGKVAAAGAGTEKD